MLSPQHEQQISSVIAQVQELARTWQGSDLEHQHRDTKLWPIAPSSAGFLESLITLNQYKNILELGTSGGYSTLHFARAALRHGGHVHTIEHDKQKIALATNHFQAANVLETITVHAGDILSILAAQELPDFFDFIFIDAEKANYKKYLEALLPRIKLGTVIVADNVMSHRKQVDDFYNFVTTKKQFVSYMWNFDTGLLLAKCL